MRKSAYPKTSFSTDQQHIGNDCQSHLEDTQSSRSDFSNPKSCLNSKHDWPHVRKGIGSPGSFNVSPVSSVLQDSKLKPGHQQVKTRWLCFWTRAKCSSFTTESLWEMCALFFQLRQWHFQSRHRGEELRITWIENWNSQPYAHTEDLIHCSLVMKWTLHHIKCTRTHNQTFLLQLLQKLLSLPWLWILKPRSSALDLGIEGLPACLPPSQGLPSAAAAFQTSKNAKLK